ncbi:MAG: hypothetical protein EPN23_04825 [Verrucomicrobia bacterium]|nr:MAG: hypothetical protein EPN23_04825 [Verrucomicrobiota bacterium]
MEKSAMGFPRLGKTGWHGMLSSMKKHLLLLVGILTVAATAAAPIENKYAPDRKVNVRNLALDVTPDFQKCTVRGTMTLAFAPIAQPLDELRLDGVDLTVDTVTCSEKLAGYQATDKEVIITFAAPLPPNREATLTIRYAAQPQKGLYFRAPANGYPAAETHLWTQGESIEARHWYPCPDHPNAKFTSEITCHVPAGMLVLSNGRKVSETADPTNGLVAVRWVQDKPHANYLMSLVAGYFATLEDQHGNVPLRFYTPVGDAPQAALSFAPTKPALEFFEREIGVPYPWQQYGQVVVRDFTWGGMENTTLTTLNDRTLHTAETETITTSEGLVAHELAHQWFGDLVTCKDWSHVWLNEGFATYYSFLFAAQQHGREELLYNLAGSAQGIFEQSTNQAERAMVFRRYDKPTEQFDYRSYPKGAWVLHMLRSQLGEDLFRRCIKTYLERHVYGTVVTEDLNAVIEELSGRSFDRFFDQWVYHPGMPVLEVTSSWDEKTKLAKIGIRQTQPVNEQSGPFHFPLTLRFKSKASTFDYRAEITKAAEDFYVPLQQSPDIVRIDPELTVLAKVNFKTSKAMRYAQLADTSDVVGRLLAAEQLDSERDLTTVAKLRDALQHDSFYGVRIKSSEALRKIHSDDALEALIASLTQSDARVRNAVVGDIAEFFHPRACAALRGVIEHERNPAILATALKALGPYHQPDIAKTLLMFLQRESHHNQLADAAIAAMRAQDDPAYITLLRAALKEREDAFSRGRFAEALNALAYLARNEKNRDEVRDFLAGYLNHKREQFQIAAIAALGALEDPKAIAVLETLAHTAKETPQQEAATKAIADLRAVNKPHDNLKDFRKEMLDLQKELQRQNKELENLKKRVEGASTKAKKK